MKIDFGGTYKEVTRLLRASASPSGAKTPGDFEKTLESIQEEIKQPTEKADKNNRAGVYQQREIDDHLDMRASYKFNEPALELPHLLPKPTYEAPPVPQVSEQLTPSQSVKTPTLLDVRKVEMAGVSSPMIPASREGITAMLHEAGHKFGVSPSLAMAVVKAESDFNPRAVSSDGHASKGLFQLLDTTGRTLLSRADNPNRHYDPFNPEMNIELGTSYLKYLHGIFSTSTALPNDRSTVVAKSADSLERFAVAAFNAGEGRVASAQHRAARAGKDPSVYDQVEPYLPKSTQSYVMRVVKSKAT